MLFRSSSGASSPPVKSRKGIRKRIDHYDRLGHDFREDIEERCKYYDQTDDDQDAEELVKRLFTGLLLKSGYDAKKQPQENMGHTHCERKIEHRDDSGPSFDADRLNPEETGREVAEKLTVKNTEEDSVDG